MVGLTFLSLAATVVLVVIALRQFVKQTQQTTKALALARQANRTANAALDATVMMTKEIERAYVDVSLVDVPVGIRNLTPGVAPSVMLKVENCGRTPGQLIATVTGLVGYVDGLPAVPVYETVPPSPATGYMMPGGCVYIVKDLHPMAAEVLDGVEAGRQKLWLVGYVRYRDRFERTHQRGFIRRYVPKRTPEQWIMDDTPGYDYDRAITDDSNA